MRSLVGLTIIGLLLSFKLEAKKIEGKIILETETIHVIFDIPVDLFSQEPNYQKLQYKVKYTDPTGKKNTLRPNHAKEIQFSFGHESVRMLSVRNTLGAGNIFSNNEYIFLKLSMDGNLKLFNYFFNQQSGGFYNGSTGTMSGGNAYSVEKYVLQKDNGDLVRPTGLTFKRDMVEYFRDCPALVEKIEHRDFRKSDLEAIVRYYNSNCR